MNQSQFFESKSSSNNPKDFWGPCIWKTIHILGATLEPKNASYFKEFLWLLTKLIPCEVCRQNLAQKLTNHPPDKYLTNNYDSFFYTYLLHDLANQHIVKYTKGKVMKKSPPYEEVKNYYFKGLGDECQSCKL